MLKHELYRAFRNRKFYLAVLVGIIIACFVFYSNDGAVKLIKTQSEIMQLTEMGEIYKYKTNIGITPQEVWIGIRQTSVSNALYYVLPLICAFVYGTSYRNDLKSGYYNNILVRGKKKQYYLSKLLAVFLSGGTVSVIPLLFSLLLGLLHFPMGPSVPGFFMFGIDERRVFGDLFYASPMAYIIIYIIYDFCFFGVVSCICLSVSCIEDNYFMVLTAPFMYYFALHAVNMWMLGNWEYSPQRYSYMKFLTYDALPVMAAHAALIVISLIPYLSRAVSRRDNWLHT